MNNNNTSELFNIDQNKIANKINDLDSESKFLSFFELSHDISYISIFMITLNILLKNISNNDNFVKIDPLKYTPSDDNKLNFNEIYGKKYYEILPHIKKCLQVIKKYERNILKTNEEIAEEIHDNINEKNKTINVIPISREIIQDIIEKNNINIVEKIKNKFFIAMNIIISNNDNNTIKNNIKFIGSDFDDNNHWLVCEINNEQISDEYFVVGLNKNIHIKKKLTNNFVRFNNEYKIDLLNFPMLERLGKDRNKYLFYDLMVDFDNTFVEYDEDKLKQIGLLKGMKFLHMPELLFNKEICKLTELGKMIIDSGLKFNIVTSRRKISENEDIMFRDNVKIAFSENINIFSMQEYKKYDKEWQAEHKYNRAKKISNKFIFFDDDEYVINEMIKKRNNYVHFKKTILQTNILLYELEKTPIIIGIQGLLGGGKTCIHEKLRKIYQNKYKTVRTIKDSDKLTVEEINEEINNNTYDIYLIDIVLISRLGLNFTNKYYLWNSVEWYYALCMVFSLTSIKISDNSLEINNIMQEIDKLKI